MDHFKKPFTDAAYKIAHRLHEQDILTASFMHALEDEKDVKEEGLLL